MWNIYRVKVREWNLLSMISQDNIINDEKLPKSTSMMGVGVGVGKLTRQLLEWDPRQHIYVVFIIFITKKSRPISSLYYRHPPIYVIAFHVLLLILVLFFSIGEYDYYYYNNLIIKQSTLLVNN